MGLGLLALATLAAWFGLRDSGGAQAVLPVERGFEAAPPARGAEAPARAPMVEASGPGRAAAPAAAYPTDPAALVRALEPLQGEVEAALAPLSAACPLGDAFLDLSLESAAGVVYVLEATLKTMPGDQPLDEHDVNAATPLEVTDPEAVRCVRERIEGATLAAPSARPGRAWRTFFHRPPAGPR
jgi:hypothetical protein